MSNTNILLKTLKGFEVRHHSKRFLALNLSIIIGRWFKCDMNTVLFIVLCKRSMNEATALGVSVKVKIRSFGNG